MLVHLTNDCRKCGCQNGEKHACHRFWGSLDGWGVFNFVLEFRKGQIIFWGNWELMWHLASSKFKILHSSSLNTLHQNDTTSLVPCSILGTEKTNLLPYQHSIQLNSDGEQDVGCKKPVLPTWFINLFWPSKNFWVMGYCYQLLSSKTVWKTERHCDEANALINVHFCDWGVTYEKSSHLSKNVE